MSATKRVSLLLGAVVMFTMAAALVIQAGVPDRASLTGQRTAGSVPVAPELNALAPSFQAFNADGDRVTLVTPPGTPVVINFWATWCAPCRVEMSELQTVYTQYQGRGLRILAVNLGEAPDVIRAWGDAFGLTFDLVIDEAQAIAAQYRLRGQPTTFIVSPGGTITQIHYGPITADRLTADLMPYFDG